jgi:hypothetical protein
MGVDQTRQHHVVTGVNHLVGLGAQVVTGLALGDNALNDAIANQQRRALQLGLVVVLGGDAMGLVDQQGAHD